MRRSVRPRPQHHDRERPARESLLSRQSARDGEVRVSLTREPIQQKPVIEIGEID